MNGRSRLIRYRWPIIAATAIISLAALLPLFSIKINPDLESYLPDDIPSRINNEKIGELFGTKEQVLLVISCDDILAPETLERIDNLTNEFINMGGLSPVLSLSTARSIESMEGSMVVNPAVGFYPRTPQEREQIRESVKKNDLVYKMLVSEDFRNALIILNSDKSLDDYKLMEVIEGVIAKYPGDESVLINGQPYLRKEANEKIGRDVMILLPIGLLLMLIFFWVSFREVKGMLLPFTVVVISIIVSMALIPLMGWELSIIGILIPIMMIAIANNYGVHFIAKYQELNALDPNDTMDDIVTEALSYLKKPVILCGLTTIVGILGLVVHILLPASQMGIVSSIGIALALFLSLTFIPALLSVMKKGKVHFHPEGGNRGLIIHMLDKTGHFLVNKPGVTLGIFIVFFLLSVAGLFRFGVASDFNEILPASHPFNKSIDIADSSFGGSKVITLVFEGDIKEPDLLNRMVNYEKQLEQVKGIGSVTSIATIIKKMSTALNDPADSAWNRIPQSRDAVAQYIELYSMNGDPADFETFVDFDYTKAAMTIQYTSDGMRDTKRVISAVNEITGSDPSRTVAGGYSLVEMEMSESVVKGQYNSLLFALAAIFILLAIIFRSFTAGLLGSLPLIFAVLCTFGFMGWSGIELNIVTALLSSISIGLGVDFTIHMFWRMKSEIAMGLSYESAARTALRTTGRGITINAFSVMLGFSVLFLSAFPLIKSFALLIILSLLFCLISALLLIPAICIIFKPGFLNRKSQS
ncbi:MAG: hypothetical protein CVT97_01515 [Bacteroidetes bacterium HGW-Bacteroidetes-14]|jgi:hypothetical protein|nr:MAG: hypothetical protein CVT97_01515 [Bacteroidetes bacterium HGW-Bacteroidetes-14]